MGRRIATASIALALLLVSGGCLLSPQPEPPDIIDDDPPEGYTGIIDDGGEAPPPGDDGDCEDPAAGGCFDGELPCSCRNDEDREGAVDCGGDERGPSALERARFERPRPPWPRDEPEGAELAAGH